MEKYSHTKRLACFFLSAMMVLGLTALPKATVSAEKTATSESDNPNTLLKLDEQAPAGLATAKNPYGYEKGVAFPLSVGNEIVYLGGWNGNNEMKTLNADNSNDLKDYITAPNKKGTSYNFDMPSGGPWNWIQAVAFDSSADHAKDNKVLFVGVNEDKDVYAWVIDFANSRKLTSTVKIGDMDWIGDDYEQFSSTSLFDVVAGDFDGDGVDTLFVYAPLDLNNDNSTGCVLYELSYNGSTLSKKNDANNLLMKQYIDDQKNKTYKDQKKTKDTRRDKLAVSMQVADFNGDNIDDLAVLSYSHYRDSNGNTNYYSPQLKICYGNSKRTSFNGVEADETFTVASTSGNTLTFPVAASLAAGDYNGDGYDDLYIVGVKSTATTGSKITEISVSGDSWYLHRFNGTLKSSMSNASYTTISSNNWFEDGFYADDGCYGKTMAVGVAISGNAAPEMLFIAGSLYDVSSGLPVHKMTESYFNGTDNGATSGGESGAITNTFVQSVIVGNFDENSAGREQVAFTIGLKQKGQDDYYYKAGLVCGTDFADSTYSDNSTCYGIATNYYCTAIDGEANYIHSDKGDNMDEGLNCMLIAVDYDDDTVEAKYLGVNYAYTDPTVIAVLQAAPYFGDIDSASKNKTSYSIDVSYSESDTDGTSKGAGGGLAFSESIPLAATISFGAGLKYNFSKTYTETLTTTYKNDFAAVSHNLVVVNRTPLLIYRYDVNTKKDWENTTQMEYCVPDAPIYSKLTVDDYNEFAQTYNDMMAKETTDYSKLQLIDKDLNWMDENEGNPYAYNQNGWSDQSILATQISKSAMAMDVGGGATSVSLTEGSSSSESRTHTFGFYAKFSSLFGPKAVANFGFELSMDFSHSWGDATVTGNSTTSSFTVQDLDGNALMNKGMPKDVLDLYGFKWTCGMWQRDLGNIDEEGNPQKTPFFGYALTNISSPPIAVDDLKVTEQSVTDNNTPKITFSWSTPESPEGWPAIDKYVLYQGVKDSNGSVTYHPVGTTEGTKTSITIDKTVDNAALAYDTEYTYMVRSAHKLDGSTAYSSYSNTVTVSTPHPSYSITLDYDENAVTVNAVKQGGITIHSGETITEDSILKITGEAKDGYTLTNLSVVNTTTNETTTVEPAEDGTITYYCKVKNNLKFKFNTKKIIKEAEVTYTESVYDETDATKVIGQVSATVSDQKFASGGIAAAPITFTASPSKGYTLTGWEVTIDDGEPHYYQTTTKNTFTLGLVGEKISVKATFDDTDNIRHTITIAQPEEGGTIALYDKKLFKTTLLVPDESGKVTVAHDATIRFEANPDTGYVIDSWSVTDSNTGESLESDNSNQDTFTLDIDRDVTVGISYNAPIKYKLTYQAEDEHTNLVTTDPYFASGSTIAAGTKVTLSAKAKDGYRIEKWSITQNSQTVEYIPDDTCCLSDSRDIIMDAPTTVEVSFVEIEQYAITLKQTGKGDFYIIRGANRLNSGDKVDYMSNILLVAKPNSGWKLSDQNGWNVSEHGTFTKLIQNIREDLTFDVVFEKITSTDDGKPGNGDSDNKDNAPDKDNGSSTDKDNSTTSGNKNDGAEPKNPNDSSKADSKATPKTGDNASVLPMIGLFTACIMIYLIRKKKRELMN